MPHYGSDREVLETALEWLRAGRRAALVTVARTWGSAPRPAGALMLMDEDGACCGSVSGGCVEEDLLLRYRSHQLGERLPTLVDYGVDREEASRLGLPCGGRLELLVEQLDEVAAIERLLAELRTGRLVVRRVCLATGEVSLHAAQPGTEFAYADGYLAKVFGPQWQLLLIGDGQLARYVARIARLLDYGVIICDPRDDYAGDPLPEGVERLRGMPDDVVAAHATHPRCAVVTLSHDPRLDDLALVDALQSAAFYVGALGSARNSALRRERLASLGLNARQLERLQAPVGLPIGSRTPPEIAVSILAEITAHRHHAVERAREAVHAA